MTTPKITYILGAGRSGSTVLERLLSSAPNAVSVGEVATLWRRPLSTLTCSCGAPALECSFWAETRRKAGFTDQVLRELNTLEHSVVRHSRLISDVMTGTDWAKRPGAQRFLGLQTDLFGALAEVAGASHVIDSSKAAPRAWALLTLQEVSILHLRRNPADVAASWRRIKHDPSLKGPMRRPSFSAIAREWLTAEISARRIGARHPVIRLDYETLISAPDAAMRHLGSLAEGVMLDERSFTPDPDYHSLNGNPDRFQRGRITLQPSAAPPLPQRDAALARLAGAALNLAAP